MTVEDAAARRGYWLHRYCTVQSWRPQLDGSRTPFDQLAEIVDAVGDRLDVLMDSGVQRGTHVLKALSLGAKAVGVGRQYLYPLAAAGQPGVERALGLMRAEIERDMRLMGVSNVGELGRHNVRFKDQLGPHGEGH